MDHDDSNYGLLFEYASEGVFVTDADGTYLDANERGLAMFGYSLDELRGMNARDLVAPEELERAPLRLSELHEGKLVTTRRWLRHRDGSHFLAEIGTRQVPDGRIIGLVRDVTEQWQTEQALRESEERFRVLVDGSPLGILIFQGGRIAFANPTIASVLGYTPGQLVDMGPGEIPELVHADDREMVFERIRSRLEGDDSPSRYEFRAVTAAGDERWLEINSSRIEYSGEPAIQTTAADVTDRKRAERELAEREAYFRTLIESATDAIVVVGLDERIRYASPAIERITGRRPEELVGMPNTELADPDDIPRIANAVVDVSVRPDRSRALSGRIRHVDGSWRRVETVGRALVERGEVTGTVVTLRDVTDRAELEEQLLRAQKMEAVGRLAGGVAHDFNNLLTVILAECAFITPADDATRSHLGEIEAAADRAAALVRQLLAFARKQIVRPTVCGVKETIEGIAVMLERTLGEHIELDLRLEDGGATVRVDEGQLEQVLLNLAVNARDAMPDGGTVVVATGRRSIDPDAPSRYVDLAPGEYAVISVSDGGHGMDDEVRRRVFDPFFTTKPDGQGSGLGLPTCYAIVTRFGGHIDVHSEPGHGTRVEVLLPVADGAAAEPRPAPRPERPHGEERILLVENDPALRRITSRLLERLGYQVVSAGGAEEALEILGAADEPFDLVFTDIVMPGMSGGELANELRDRYPTLPILFTSGYMDDAALRRELEEEDVSFLPKPYTLDELAAAVRRPLDARRR